MKNKIKKIIENEAWVSGMDAQSITDKIYEVVEFNILEYTNFINENYKPFAGDWIRKSDDKIIYNTTEILDDFIISRTTDEQ